MDILNTIIEPIVTEKSSQMQGNNNQYVFKVGKGANKVQIKKMFELMYEAKVAKVQVMLVPRKTRMLRGKKVLTKRPLHKKAIITLKKDQKPVDIHKVKLTTKK